MVASRNISERNFSSTSPGPEFKVAQTPSDPSQVGSTNLSQLTREPQYGEFKRQLVTWRTPHLGYVQMYINPQNIDISEAKDISHTRTKAGFIIQYAGEQLTEISISGTTGSAGIEGINILEQVYRAEQYAFEPIAEALERNVSTANIVALLKGTFNIGETSNALIDNYISQSAAEAVLDIFQQPFPTLASLAASIEMFFQGVTYKGYFKNFKVSESGNEPGHFTYSMNFVAYAKQGVRYNFMPWHRRPIRPADWNGPNTMSYYGEPLEASQAGRVLSQTQTPPESGNRSALAETFQGVTVESRNRGNALGSNGRNLNNIDLRNTEL